MNETYNYYMLCLQTVIHKTTKETPFFLIYKRDLILLSDLFMNKQMESQKKIKQYKREVAKRFIVARKRVKKKTMKQKENKNEI